MSSTTIGEIGVSAVVWIGLGVPVICIGMGKRDGVFEIGFAICVVGGTCFDGVEICD